MAKAKKAKEEKPKEKKISANKKEKGYFKVDDEIVFELIEKLKKKSGIDKVDMVTCTELAITWLAAKFTKEDIEKMLK